MGNYATFAEAMQEAANRADLRDTFTVFSYMPHVGFSPRWDFCKGQVTVEYMASIAGVSNPAQIGRVFVTTVSGNI